MANNNPQLDYTTIPNPYPRSENAMAKDGVTEINQTEGGRTVLSGQALTNAWIDTWIKSTGYEPKKRGFLIDGQKGYIECMKLWVGQGGVVGGSLDIPDTVTAASFHVDTLGNTWWGATTLAASVASVLNTGAGTFSNITITGGTIGGVSVSNIGNATDPTLNIVPVGFTCSSTTAVVATDGSVSSSVVLTWTAVVSATFDHYIIRYKKNGYTYFQNVTSNDNTINIQGLIPATEYRFNIASVNKYGSVSAYTTVLTDTGGSAIDDIQMTATSTTPPATVTAGSATAGIQLVIVKWTANTESDLASYNVYRHTSNNSAASTLWANIRTNYFIDSGMVSDGTTYYYWIKAVNTSSLLSAAYSTEVHAVPRNIVTNDIGANQITAPLTSLAAINPVSGDLNFNTVGTSQLTDNAVGSQESNIALRGWTQTLVFTSTDADTVTWTATAPNNDKFTASNGDSYTIATGNTGNMTAKTYIYLCPAVSTTAYQYTTVAADAIGDGKVLIAIAQNNTTEATFMLLNNNSYNIDAANIVAGSITANEIQAGAVIASKITSYNFQVSAGAFANNSPTAGKVSWTGCKVVYAGTEYSITNGSCLATDKHIYWQLATPTVFSASATLPALGDKDFLVAFNNSGTVILVWNSTIINGNRITTGSVTATNMAANTITANEIAAGTITADRINSNSFAFSAISFTADSPTAGKVAWTGCKVVYKGTEYTITNGNCETTDKHIYWQLASPNIFSASATLPALGNDDFLVVYNDSGTPKYVWNSTIINGNRISTGSIYTGQIATGTILGSNIASGTIASSNVLSISADKILIDGAATFLNSWFSYKGIYAAGTIYSKGDQVSYLSDLWNYINTTPGAGHTPAENTYWTAGGASQITTIDGGEITTGTITTSTLNFVPVESTNVIASINSSAEGITIDADNISISGSTTFSPGYDPTEKITTFLQDNIPTSIAIGDIWIDTNDGNKMYRAASVGADQIAVGEWELVIVAGGATIFAQDAIPTSLAIGDIWYDTNDGNKQYWAASIGADQIVAGEWEPVSDNNKLNNVGGSYSSAASGARVSIFPDANTGIQVTNGTNNVLMVYVGGAGDPGTGDIIIGDYANSKGVKWDNSATTFTVKGSLVTGASSQVDAQYLISSNIVNTLTMGTAGSAGYIQSYGWNGTVNGYQLKGGATPSFTLIGGAITGTTIKTALTGVRVEISGNDAFFYDDTTGGSSPITGDTASIVFDRTDADEGSFLIQKRKTTISNYGNALEMFYEDVPSGGQRNYLFIGREGGAGSAEADYKTHVLAGAAKHLIQLQTSSVGAHSGWGTLPSSEISIINSGWDSSGINSGGSRVHIAAIDPASPASYASGGACVILGIQKSTGYDASFIIDDAGMWLTNNMVPYDSYNYSLGDATHIFKTFHCESIQLRHSDNGLYGTIDTSSGFYNITTYNNRNAYLNAGSGTFYFGSNASPITDGSDSLGEASYQWNNIYGKYFYASTRMKIPVGTNLY